MPGRALIINDVERRSMTVPPVSAARTITIKQVFEQHLQLGQAPPAALEATNAWLKSCGDVEGLPRDWKLDLRGADIVVLVDGAELDPAQIHVPDDWEEAAIGGMPVSELMKRVQPADRIQRAILCLSALLKPDDSVSRGKYKTMIMKEFDLGVSEYAEVWRAARERIGLPREGSKGSKKGVPKPRKS
jgi:hypothetical protein